MVLLLQLWLFVPALSAWQQLACGTMAGSIAVVLVGLLLHRMHVPQSINMHQLLFLPALVTV